MSLLARVKWTTPGSIAYTIPGLRKAWVHEWKQGDRFRAEKILLHEPIGPAPEVSRHWMSLDKKRLGTVYPVKHQWMQAVCAEVLERTLNPTFGKHLVSYQKGRKIDEIFKDLREFLKGRNEFYVVRWDIKSYTDSIPLHDRSHLWSALNHSGLQPWVARLKNELRPVVTREYNEPCAPFSVCVGVSFGSPMTPPLANLYLCDFDSWVTNRFSKSFYRRFGDDCILVLQQRPEFALIPEIVKKLGDFSMSINEKKTVEFRWNQSGFQGRQTVEYLGRSISAKGLLFLTDGKAKRLRDLWKQTLRRLEAKKFDVNLIDILNEYMKAPEAEELKTWVDDSRRVKSFSDRLRILTKENDLSISLYQLWVKKFIR